MSLQNASDEAVLTADEDFVAWNTNARNARGYIPAGVIVICLFIIGLPGNCMVVYVYHYYFKVSIANFYIKVLAVLDALCCVFAMTYEVVDMFFPLLDGEPYTCKIFRTIEQSAEFISAEVLILIAYDRYLQICKPFKIKTFSTARRLVILAIVIGCVAASPTLLVMKIHEIDIDGRKMFSCSRDLFYNTTFTLTYYLILNFLLAVDFVFMIGFYILIWITLNRLKYPTVTRRSISSVAMNVSPQTTTDIKDPHRKPQGTSTSQTIDQGETLVNNVISKVYEMRRRRMVKPVIVLFMVTLVFLISYLPYCILALIEDIRAVDVMTLPLHRRQIWEVFSKSYFLSNVVNPAIYATMDHKFRRKCQDILCRKGHFRNLRL